MTVFRNLLVYNYCFWAVKYAGKTTKAINYIKCCARINVKILLILCFCFNFSMELKLIRFFILVKFPGVTMREKKGGALQKLKKRLSHSFGRLCKYTTTIMCLKFYEPRLMG